MGKIAIVTGAGSGIGAALSRALIARGDTVLLADIDEAAARGVCGAIGNERARPVGLDVRDEVAVADLVNAVVSEYGRLDLMVNNAGIGMRGELQEFTPEHWNRIIDINLRGVLHGVAAAYPVMLRQRGGAILNMASSAALWSPPMLSPYVMTKHAVVGLSVGIRPEAAAHGISVTVACPGVVDTPFLDKGGPDDLPRTRSREHFDPRATFKRIGGLYSADDAARDILAAVDRNRAMIVTPRVARALWRVNRLLPGLVDRVSRNTARRMLQHLDSVAPLAAPAKGSAEPGSAADDQAGVA